MNENEVKPLLLEYDNPYWKDNPEMFGQLYWIVKIHPKAYGKIVLSSECVDIRKWIILATPKLNDPIYKISTKIVWILTGQTEFQKCLNPNCQNLVGIGTNYGFTRRSLYCCPMCQKTSPLVNEKKRQKILSHLDTDPEYFDKLEAQKKQTKVSKGLPPNWCNGKKISASLKHRLAEDPDFWKKREFKSKLTKIQKGLNPNWRNAEKNLKTRQAKYGAFESQSIAQKRKATSQKKYGCDFPIQSEQIKQKRADNCVKKYGVSSPMKLERVKQCQSNAIYSKYGVRHIMQLPAVQRRVKRKYFYDGVFYSSGDEIYFLIYHRDIGDDIVYQPDIKFEYEFGGKVHSYHPDFLLNGNVVELKGDQFFRPNGTMFCPFRNKLWTDEQYADRCAKEEAKHQCMLMNGVQIIRSRSEHMIAVRKYVDSKYGKSYIKSFRH